MFQSDYILLDEEKMAKERKKKLREFLIQTYKENHQVGIIISLFSAFCGVNDRRLHQRWASVTLSPTEPHHKYQIVHTTGSVLPSWPRAWDGAPVPCPGDILIDTLCDHGKSGVNLGWLPKLLFSEWHVTTNVDLL